MSGRIPRLRTALDTTIAALRDRKMEPIRVAVLDSGMDGSHPELAGHVEAAYVVEEDEASGKISVVEVDPGTDSDAYGHGTNVGSIIRRVAPHVRLTSVRVLGGHNRGSGEQLMAGLEHALNLGLPLYNMSLAVGERFQPLVVPLCEAAYRRGQVIVASRRNMPFWDEGCPASLISCVGVDNGGRGPEMEWEFVRDGVIEFSANGTDLPAAAPGGAYTTVTGTSFATPIMTGVVALLLGAYPGLRPFEVKSLLKAFAARGDEVMA